MVLFSADDLIYVSKQIELNDDEFDELFSNFEPTHTSLNSFIISFLHSQFDKERVRDILNRWYNKIEDSNERTNTKRDVLDTTKTSYRLFIEEYINEFAKEEGFNCKDAFEYYKAFCSSNGFISYASNKFGAYIRPYVERKRVRINGQLEWRYFIKTDFKVDDDENEVVDLDAK